MVWCEGAPTPLHPPTHPLTLPQALRTADGAQSLAELAGAGVRNTTAADVVAAAIRLKDELAGQTQRRVLLAVDDYNALYHRTTYGEAVHPLHRRQLQPDELRLVRAGCVESVSGMALHVRDRTQSHVPSTPSNTHPHHRRCKASG